MENLLEKYTGFMGSVPSYDEGKVILVGIPMDFTVSFRPGARLGPQSIRNVSFGLEEYSVYLDRLLEEVKFYDAGDISLPFGNVMGSLEQIEKVARRIIGDGKYPLFLGGEHLVTYPIIKAMVDKYPDLAVIHFDAHADLREDYVGEIHSHATVMHKVSHLIGGKNLYQFGIRSGTKEEFAFARENTRMVVDRIFPELHEVVASLGQRPVYISLDIDVVDPAFAPGTGTPEPGGCTSREILQAIHAMKSLNVVGFDLVEVLPSGDISERTAILGAKLVREALLSFW